MRIYRCIVHYDNHEPEGRSVEYIGHEWTSLEDIINWLYGLDLHEYGPGFHVSLYTIEI